uniref:HAT C-terminal dimerisation domain-containing protein n=1 Tax=Amphimedon queenslandica TaxID=400682 RepID=A0A1X7UJM6_AMPQE
MKCVTRQCHDLEFQNVCKFYGSDIKPKCLKVQLQLLHSAFRDKPIDDIDIQSVFLYIRSQGSEYLSKIYVIVQLIQVVVPATNASSERSFNALKRIKSFLRSTMTQSRLNHLMTIHVHKETLDQLLLKNVAQEFIDGNESHLTHFRKFD